MYGRAGSISCSFGSRLLDRIDHPESVLAPALALGSPRTFRRLNPQTKRSERKVLETESLTSAISPSRTGAPLPPGDDDGNGKAVRH